MLIVFAAIPMNLWGWKAAITCMTGIFLWAVIYDPFPDDVASNPPPENKI